MPAAGFVSLDKGEVMMYLAIAGLQRRAAASEAGVSERTFRRLMRRYRIKAPKSYAKLTAADAEEIRALLKKHTRAQVAAMKGVHIRTVDQVSNYETWFQI